MKPLPDMWTALSFDMAVRTFGIHIENQLNERDEHGNRLHMLEDLLDIKLPLSEQLRRNSEMFMAFRAFTKGVLSV